MAEEMLLAGRRILVVEDEYFIAQDICDVLSKWGAEIIGPASRLTDGLELAQRSTRIDCALLDYNLHGESSLDIAQSLLERGVPFVILTGYDAKGIPEELGPRLIKPFDEDILCKTVLGTIAKSANLTRASLTRT